MINFKILARIILVGISLSALLAHESKAVSERFTKTQGDLNGSTLTGSSSVNYDYDLDGEVETITIGNTGAIYFINNQGVIEHSYNTLGISSQRSSPSIADIDNDGWLEIVFGGDGRFNNVNKPALYAIHSDMSTQGSEFPINTGLEYCFSSHPPTLYDFNGDGYQEIIAGTNSPCYGIPGQQDRLVCLAFDGNRYNELWEYRGIHFNASFPIGDINGDNVPEIFLGTRESCDGDAGEITCLEALSYRVIWTNNLSDLNERSSAWSCYGLALGDIQADGNLELVAVTGGYEGTNPPVPNWSGKLLVLNAEDGTLLFDRAIYGYGKVPPALCDFDKDGQLDIISGGTGSGFDQGEDAIYCWDSQGNLHWSLGPDDDPRFYKAGAGSPIIASFSIDPQNPEFDVLLNVADINNDARLWLYKMPDYQGLNGYLYNSTEEPFNYPQEISGNPISTPALLGGWDNGNMSLTTGVFTGSGSNNPILKAFDTGILNDSAHIEWGMYYHDPKHTGRYNQPVTGYVERNAAWYGKYILRDYVAVNSGATLIIEAGTRVEVADKGELVVSPGGHLIIKGTPGNPVVFTSTSDRPQPGIWRGIFLNEGANATISNCIIEYSIDGIFAKANTIVDVESTLFRECLNSGFNGTKGHEHIIRYSTFDNCYNYGAVFTGGSPVLFGDTIRGGDKYGVKYLGGGSIQIQSCIVTTVQDPSYWGIYIGPYGDLDQPIPCLRDDSISYFAEGGIYVFNAQSSDGVIGGGIKSKSNGGYGLYLANSSPFVGAPEEAYHNTFSLEKYGIFCGKGSNSKFRWNKVVLDACGIYVTERASPDFGTERDYGQNKIVITDPHGLEMIKENDLICISAQGNWWGDDGPQTQGNIDTRNRLDRDPMVGDGKRDSHYNLPVSALIASNYPNPFNSNTEIRFSLPQSAVTAVKIYDISGRMINELVSGGLDAGEQSVVWNGTDLTGQKVSSGVYFYSITTTRSQLTQKMVLLK